MKIYTAEKLCYLYKEHNEELLNKYYIYDFLAKKYGLTLVERISLYELRKDDKLIAEFRHHSVGIDLTYEKAGLLIDDIGGLFV